MKISTFVVFMFTSLTVLFAQDFTKFSVGGYVDTYYSYDDDKNGNSQRQLTSIAPFREEFRLNLAQVTVKYNDEKVRGVVTAHYGDMVTVNWPASQQFIQEAYAGFSPRKGLWIDAGYFLTHIGAEGFAPKGNLLTSLALGTYYEPFFQSGIRIGYDFSDKFFGCFHLLNGYNVFADNNKNKSAGITLDYKPNSKVEIIYNNIFGNEMNTGTAGRLRIYNNLVLKFYPAKNLDVIIGGDIGFQENSKLDDTAAYANMYSASASIRYKFSKRVSATVRGEIFNDNDGFLSGIFTDAKGKSTGLKTYGVTFGIEVRPVENAYFRVETRYLSADPDQKIFFDNKNSKFEVITNAGIEF